MPIYEFTCRQCRIKFDALCKAGVTDDVKCPECNGSDIVRVMSIFSSRINSSGSSCSSCSSGGCGGDCGSCGSGCSCN